MNILSSPLWPSDMPDDRRVIALLGLVQISEDKMSLVQAVEQMEEEIERLNALVAMQSEALNECKSFIKCEEIPSIETLGHIDKALSATAETVSAYQNEVKAKALEEAADRILSKDRYTQEYVAQDGKTKKAIFYVSPELRKLMSDELRAKGE